MVKSGTGEDASKEQLGGSAVHAGNAAVDLIAASEAGAFGLIRRFLSYLPPSAYQLPPVAACADPAGRREAALLSAVPRDRRQPYRIRPILAAVFDAGSVMEVQHYGGSVVTALARLDGHPVGVLAGDTYMAGGCLTVEGAEAVTRLADLCSTFHLPIVALTDQPGLLIGSRAEQRGTIRHGVRAISAVYQASVPAAEIIVRRVFGVGGAGITNRHRLARRWAWPSADWGSLPVEGGTEAAYRAELAAADDPAATLAGIRARLDAVRNPLRTAERFGIEDIIDPRETRPLLCDWVRDAYATLPASPAGRSSAPAPESLQRGRPGRRSAVQRAGIGGHVDGVLAQRVERHDLQRPLVRGGEHHPGCGAVVVGPQPVRRRHAPAVPRHQPGELVLRHGGGQVVADPALMLEELGGHHRADRVTPPVLGPGAAAAVPVEPGDRVSAARFQLPTQHIAIAHLSSISHYRAGRAG